MAFSTETQAADIRVRDVALTEDELSVALMDGRTITVPLAWYPRLANATPAQRARWEIAGGGFGIHWPEIDEDLSTEGLLRGSRAPRGSDAWRSPGLAEEAASQARLVRDATSPEHERLDEAWFETSDKSD